MESSSFSAKMSIPAVSLPHFLREQRRLAHERLRQLQILLDHTPDLRLSAAAFSCLDSMRKNAEEDFESTAHMIAVMEISKEEEEAEPVAEVKKSEEPVPLQAVEPESDEDEDDDDGLQLKM